MADADERTAQIEKLSQAVMFALLTANEQPYPMAAPAVHNIAALLHDCGVVQTDNIAAEITLPGWITQRVREQSAEVPVEPDHHAIQETDRVMTAPVPPARIAKKYMGVVTE